MGQRVLITGISRHLAAKLARRLEADPDVEHIVGIDRDEPQLDLERTEFVRADIRNPLAQTTLESDEVDTVVHLSVIATPMRVGGRSVMKEINVVGTLQLLAACQKAPSIRKLVMKSTTSVYGAAPQDPAVFTEDMGWRSQPTTGYARDSVQVEEHARDFARRRPEATVSILRFANFMGSEIETPLTRYFSLPVIPVALGHDPRIQFIHEDDAVEVLYRSVRQEHPGIWNVAADGILLLSQAVRICGKPWVGVPLPLAGPLGGMVRRFGWVDIPADQLRFLVDGRIADNSRLKEAFGFVPRYTTRGALEEFLQGQRFRRLFSPDQAIRWEDDVVRFLQGRAMAPAEEG